MDVKIAEVTQNRLIEGLRIATNIYVNLIDQANNGLLGPQEVLLLGGNVLEMTTKYIPGFRSLLEEGRISPDRKNLYAGAVDILEEICMDYLCPNSKQ
jgi:hypothetical protein